MRQRLTIAFLITLFVAGPVAAADEDPYLWLEEVEGAKALEWAKAKSAADTAVLEAVPEYAEIHAKLLEIYNSRDRIPTPAIRGAWIYNFWRDADHVRGIWRRTFLSEFVKDQPAWEIVLDLDALAESEGENWVWNGANCLGPEYRLCMVSLSRGGADAAVEREFDSTTKTFVDDGFFLPEAKAQIDWKDENTLWVGTDFGEGSLTNSGYPRTAREWKRGTPVGDATTVFEGSINDVFVVASSDHTPEGRYDLVNLTPEFFRGTNFLRLDGRLVKLDIPEDATFNGFFKDRLLLACAPTGPSAAPPIRRTRCWPSTSTTSSRAAGPSRSSSNRRAGFARRVASTRNHLLFTTLDNVRSRLYRLTPGENGWTREEIGLPGLGTVGIGSTGDVDDTFFFTYTDFLTPASLYLVRDGAEPVQVKTSPAWFDADGMTVAQYEATSKDGTQIPYFVVTPKGFEADGQSPTLLYGYGGFEVSAGAAVLRPTSAPAWLARGGVYVLANIRGGGEFGPSGTRRPCKRNTRTSFEDFIAVAEDLIARKITSPEHLGIMGGSQGGLLVGGAFVQRPDLFKAVVCSGAAAGHEALQQAAGRRELDGRVRQPRLPRTGSTSRPGRRTTTSSRTWSTPKVFFWTTTRDDRVHPGHARKMVAKMTDHGQAGLLLREHRGRARRRRQPQPARLHGRPRVRLPVDDACADACGRSASVEVAEICPTS